MIRELTGLSVDFLRKPRASGDDPDKHGMSLLDKG